MNNDELPPFLKWVGGKRWLVSNYPELLATDCDRYVEPFLGSAAVFFALDPKRALLSDMNRDLIETYRAIKNDSTAVSKALTLHQRMHVSDENYYYRMRSAKPQRPHPRAARFIYLNRTCFNGLFRVNLKGEFNVPKGTKAKVLLPTDNFEEAAKRLRSASLRVSDFEEVLDQCGEGDFAFVDPPYTVRHNNNGFLKYNEKIFSWDDQQRLVACLRRYAIRGGRALVTNAAHKSIFELYSGLGTLRLVTRQSVLAASGQYRAL